MKKLYSLLLGVFFFYQVPVKAQFLSGIIVNRYDKTNKHHGKWKYIDRANKRRLMCQGTFYHGKQVGEWKYYHPSGKLRMLEKYATKEDRRLIEVTYYHENGLIANHGTAIVEASLGKARYYWSGNWTYFEDNGSLVKTVTYNNGQPIQSVYPDGRVEYEYETLPLSKPITIPVP